MNKSLSAAALLLGASAVALADGQAPSRLAGRLPGKVDTGRTIVLEADVGCDPARAYRLWSTREGVQSFFAPRAEIGAVGGPYAVMFFPAEDPQGLSHGTTGARVLAAQADRFYAFEWIVFAGADDKGRQAPPYAEPALRLRDPLPTWVELEFTPAAGGARGTHVAFRHFGFGDGEAYAQSQAWFTRAWSGVLQQMQRACG